MGSRRLNVRCIIIWVLVIGHMVLISFGTFFKIMHWPYWEIVLAGGLSCLISSWAVILSEIIRNDIDKRTYWLMSMFILPTISPVFYMIRREKLIRRAATEDDLELPKI